MQRIGLARVLAGLKMRILREVKKGRREGGIPGGDGGGGGGAKEKL